MTTECKEPPPWKPCQVNGDHVVENIQKIEPGSENHNVKIEMGFNYQGTCKFCNGNIVGKTKEELEVVKEK